MKIKVFSGLLKAMVFMLAVFTACTPKQSEETKTSQSEEQEINVYTHRHYESDQQLFKDFEALTGIKVNVVNASADELIQKLELEGAQSPADVLITVDAGRLHRAKEKVLLQPVTSNILNENVPPHLRDAEGHWYGLSYRARVIAYAKDRVQPEQLSDYESLIDPQWKGKILIRSSGNIYNQSLLASIIAAQGEQKARAWAEGMVANMAREPKGNDRDQVKAIAAGLGDLAIVNTYYVGLLLNSENEEEVKAGESVGIFFPNQNDRGTHINVSGIGVTKYAPNKENAVKFIEFLSGPSAQEVFAKGNYEYPVKPGIGWAGLLQSWGTFKTDSLDLSLLGANNKQAVMTFDQVGWQ